MLLVTYSQIRKKSFKIVLFFDTIATDCLIKFLLSLWIQRGSNKMARKDALYCVLTEQEISSWAMNLTQTL
jgi:hypothetical protein